MDRKARCLGHRRACERPQSLAERQRNGRHHVGRENGRSGKEGRSQATSMPATSSFFSALKSLERLAACRKCICSAFKLQGRPVRFRTPLPLRWVHHMHTKENNVSTPVRRFSASRSYNALALPAVSFRAGVLASSLQAVLNET